MFPLPHHLFPLLSLWIWRAALSPFTSSLWMRMDPAHSVWRRMRSFQQPITGCCQQVTLPDMEKDNMLNRKHLDEKACLLSLKSWRASNNLKQEVIILACNVLFLYELMYTSKRMNHISYRWEGDHADVTAICSWINGRSADNKQRQNKKTEANWLTLPVGFIFFICLDSFYEYESMFVSFKLNLCWMFLSIPLSNFHSWIPWDMGESGIWERSKNPGKTH